MGESSSGESSSGGSSKGCIIAQVTVGPEKWLLRFRHLYSSLFLYKTLLAVVETFLCHLTGMVRGMEWLEVSKLVWYTSAEGLYRR